MDKIRFSEIIDRMRRVAQVEDMPISGIFMYLAEEVGEVAVSINVQNGHKRRKVKETYQEECVDVMLNTLRLILHDGQWTKDDILDYMNKKLIVWENKIIPNEREQNGTSKVVG